MADDTKKTPSQSGTTPATDAPSTPAKGGGTSGGGTGGGGNLLNTIIQNGKLAEKFGDPSAFLK